MLALSSTLNHAAGKERGITISPRDVYGHPTINALADFLQNSGNERDSAPKMSREEVMANMVEKYTHDLSKRRAPAISERPEKHTYILTKIRVIVKKNL